MLLGSIYHTYEEIKSALEKNKVDGILVDLYLYSSNKDIFSHSAFRIMRVLDYKTTYGVVLAKDSMKLQRCINSFVQYNRGMIFDYVKNNIEVVEVCSLKVKCRIYSIKGRPRIICALGLMRQAWFFVVAVVVVVVLFVFFVHLFLW